MRPALTFFSSRRSTGALHEDFLRDEASKPGKDRVFGLVMAAAFAVLGLLPMVKDRPMRVPLIVLGVLFLVVAVVAPAVLHPLNRLWTAFGSLLHALVSPLILLLLFVFGILPTAIVMRLMRRDPMTRTFSPEQPSYWIARPAQPSRESMSRQY